MPVLEGIRDCIDAGVGRLRKRCCAAVYDLVSATQAETRLGVIDPVAIVLVRGWTTLNGQDSWRVCYLIVSGWREVTDI